MTEELRKKLEIASEEWDESLYRDDAFLGGINCYLNSLWHDASEEPELNSTIVIKWASDTHISIAEFNGCVSYSKNRFRVQSDLGYGEISVSKWCYLDDILPDNK